MALSREQFQQLRNKGLSVEQIVKFERGEKPTQATSVATPKEPSFLNKVGQNTLGMMEDLTFGVPRTIVEQTVGRGVGALTGDDALKQKLMNLPRGNQFLSGIGQAVAEPLVEGYKFVMPNIPLTPEIPAKKIAQTGGLGLLGLLAQKAVPETIQPTQHGVAEAVIPMATDPRGFLFGGGVGKTIDTAGDVARAVVKAPGKIGSGIKDVFTSGKQLRSAQVAQERIGQSIERLKDAKAPAFQDLVDSAVDDAVLYKNKLRPLSKENSKIYGEALDKIESQVNITQGKFKSLIQDTIDEAIEAGVPNNSPVLGRLKTIGEKYGSKSEEVIDDIFGRRTNIIDEKLSVNDLKSIKNDIFKIADETREGADDVTNAIFMKNYGREIASQSKDFAKLQGEYAPYLEAKKWAYRTFKPFTKDEIPNGNRVLRLIAQGKARPEDFAYLERLEQGSGRFKGSGIMRQKSESMAKELKSISDEINQLRRAAVKTKANVARLERLTNLRNWIAGGALTALGAGAVAKTTEKVSGAFR